MSSINWGRLLSQDRCKDIGVPWTEEEAKAIYKDSIPAAYVRAGIKTPKGYQKVQNEEEVTGEKEVRFMSRSELVAILGEYKTELTILAETPDSVIREAVEVAIKKGTKIKDDAEEETNEEETEEETEDGEEIDEEETEEEDTEVETEEEEEIVTGASKGDKNKAQKSNRSRGRNRARS